MKTALSIAGSDCSGGAGIQADLKTMTMQGVYAMSAITALTAQNTTGVSGILEVPPEFLEKQLDAVFQDITPDAVKIGMVSGIGLIRVIHEKLIQYKAEHIVVDPVMVSTSGSDLLAKEALAATGPGDHAQHPRDGKTDRYEDPGQRDHGAGSKNTGKTIWLQRAGKRGTQSGGCQ